MTKTLPLTNFTMTGGVLDVAGADIAVETVLDIHVASWYVRHRVPVFGVVAVLDHCVVAGVDAGGSQGDYDLEGDGEDV